MIHFAFKVLKSSRNSNISSLPVQCGQGVSRIWYVTGYQVLLTFLETQIADWKLLTGNFKFLTENR